MTGKGNVQLSVQQKTEPCSGVVEERVKVGRAWKLYAVSAVAGHTFSGEDMLLAFNAGDHRQTLEFGPFYVLNIGQ